MICFVEKNEPKRGGEFSARLSQTVWMQRRSRSVMWNSLQVLHAIFMSLCKMTKKLILLSTKQVALRVEQRATPQRPLCVCVFLHVHVNWLALLHAFWNRMPPCYCNNKQQKAANRLCLMLMIAQLAEMTACTVTVEGNYTIQWKY